MLNTFVLIRLFLTLSFHLLLHRLSFQMLQPRIVSLNLPKVRLQRFQVASQLGDAFQLAWDAGVQDVEVGVDLCEACIEFTTLAHEHQYRVDDDEQGQGEYGAEHDLGAEDDVEDLVSLKKIEHTGTRRAGWR